ncbi:MAG: hypothetical protein IKO97_07345 [Erysipelotrichaceae bacterium]|nr:hypothetical protein [Erysipelotrichaceae bacterium]
MKLMTVGQIKTLDLTKKLFTLEPIAAYKFILKDGDDEGWKIIFKDATVSRLEELEKLHLYGKDATFKFDDSLASAMVMLKQSKTKIEVRIADSKKADGDGSPSDDDKVMDADITVP